MVSVLKAQLPTQSSKPTLTARKVGDWLAEINGHSRSPGWRSQVGSRLEALQAEIDSSGKVPSCVPRAMEVACAATGRRRWRPGLKNWFSGAKIEQAWHAIHVAEVWLYSTRPDLDDRVRSIRAKVEGKLPEKDPRCVALEPEKFKTLSDGAKQIVVREALRAAYQASGVAEVAVRSLRNRIILFGLVLLVLNVVVALFVSLKPARLALCDGDPGTTCMRSLGESSAFDVVLLQLFGALGGAIAVVILLQRTKPSVVVYSVAPYQAAVKILLGSVFALLGVLFLGTGALPAITTWPAVLLFAVVLGYSQQLGTRLLDRYADEVVQTAQPTANPSKRPQSPSRTN